MRRIVMMLAVVGLSLSLATTGRAHDLRILVARMMAAPGQDDTVYVSYGHVLPVDQPIDADWLQDYFVKTPSGSILTMVKEGISLQSNVIHVEELGLYQAVATQKPAVWTEVVDTKGVHTHVRSAKKSIKEGTAEHAMLIKKYAKAMLVSGSQSTSPPEALGHELEIVPVEPSNDWKAGHDLKFKLLYRGKPLPSADLVATYIGFKPDAAWCYATTGDAKGVATVRPQQAGTWVLRVKTTRGAARDKQEEYDEEVVTATLVLEINP
jgi:uncharacterized GH25 family protein